MKETISLEKLIDKDDFIKKICTGIDHVLILFSSGKLGIFGDNSKGQLGLPLKSLEMENKINELLIYIPKIQDDRFKKHTIVDIACEDDCSLLLIEANNKNYLFRVGYREEDYHRDKLENLNIIVKDFFIKNENKFIYSLMRHKFLSHFNYKILNHSTI